MSEIKKRLYVFFMLALMIVSVSGAVGIRRYLSERSSAAKEREDISQTNETDVLADRVEPADGREEEDSPVDEAEACRDDIAVQVQVYLEKMTIEEKVGQMFIAGCPGEDAAAKVRDYHLGGYILFGPDFSGKTKEEIVQTIESYQAEAEIPLLIGVDEEGGTVNRISTNGELREAPFAAPRDLYEGGGFELIRSDTKEKCDLLRSLGINVNFAPVCDISTDRKDFMYNRSFGKDAEETAKYVQNVVEVMKEEGMGCVLKHFPGYGNNRDTHTDIVFDEREYSTFQTSDFLPFQAGIDSGADMVLVSHNIVSSMDEGHPASLSPKVHEILRGELGFSGVIITDDLAMDGVRLFASDTETAVLAVQAGNDLLCCTDFEVQIPAVIEAVQQGEISRERIDESVFRILMYKFSNSLLPK